MKPDNKLQIHNQATSKGLIHFLEILTGKFFSIFKPEEVEVTFKNEGNKMSYTYKVTHK